MAPFSSHSKGHESNPRQWVQWEKHMQTPGTIISLWPQVTSRQEWLALHRLWMEMKTTACQCSVNTQALSSQCYSFSFVCLITLTYSGQNPNTLALHYSALLTHFSIITATGMEALKAFKRWRIHLGSTTLRNAVVLGKFQSIVQLCFKLLSASILLWYYSTLALLFRIKKKKYTWDI